MKRFKVRMRIKRTSMSYEGFGQITDCEYTHIMSDDYAATDASECIDSLKQIFGEEIISGFVVDADTNKVAHIKNE